MDRPLVYYSFSLFLGCLICYLLLNSIYLSFILIGLFLIIIYRTVNKKYFILVCGFLIAGIISYFIYFNFNLKANETLRVIEVNHNKVVGTIHNRKVFMTGKLNNVNKGDILICNGSYKKKPMYDKGMIGIYNVESFKIEKDIISKIEEYKRNTFKKLLVYQGEENSALIMALCLGDKDYLSYDKKGNMNTLGISHIISLSGFHIAAVYGILQKIFGYKIALIMTFIYVIITGMSASTVRAFIMILILVMSKVVQRNYDTLSSISFAAMILLLLKPYYILDMGFMLSFLSVIGITTTYKYIKDKLNFLPNLIRDSISMTLSAMVFTFPYLALNMNTISFNGILSNLILIPFYSPLIIIGNISLLSLNVKFLFELINYVLTSLLFIINTAECIFLDNMSDVIKITYMQALFILILYYSYIFYKKKYKNSLYVPIVFLLITIISNYSFYPEINYIKEKNHNIINIKYKNKSVLISNKIVKLSKIKSLVQVDDIYDEINSNTVINLKNNYKIIAVPSGRNLDLVLYSKNNKILFTANKIKQTESDYDKIKFIEDDEYGFNGLVYKRYKIIKDNVFEY
ncbi:MAG: ComEC/Rec2 family competence protein [Clostridium argentinense]|nr:ComEC/Rec2 family competence protein [uncultured Clostridium sp.]MBS5824512.1 ComEC/Rec2 family competence protein [Clostridium argentinense]MDU1348349.1 ComEC/Rec2 family competence protein [Clostridium argentinense]